MAHDGNGRIFIGATGIEISDLQAVFGLSNNAIGALITRAATLGRINKWAKSKPVRSNLLKTMTQADMQGVYFGLKVTPSGNIITDFISNYATEWTYSHPRGIKNTTLNPTSTDEWFRFRDFNGYDNRAICFFYERGCTLPSSYTVGRGGGGTDFILAFNGNNELTSKGSITVGDFALVGTELNLGQFYCGFLFVHSGQNNQTVYEVITSSTQAASAQTSTIHFSESNNVLDNFETGKTYTYYPVLSQYQHATLTRYRNSQQDVLIALPDPYAPRTFKVREVTTELFVFFGDEAYAWIAERGRIKVRFSAKCGGQSTMGASYRIYEASNDEDMSGDPITNTETMTLNDTTYTTVSTGLINVTGGVPAWVRVHLYYTNNDAVYDDLFIFVSDEEPDII